MLPSFLFAAASADSAVIEEIVGLSALATLALTAAMTAQADDFFGDFGFSVGVTGLSAAAVARIPVAEMFALFGKVGFASYDLEFDVTLDGASGSDSESESDMVYGGGAALSFGAFEVRAEYEVLNVEDGDVNMISVSGLYRF
jgi:hypothetical protein